DGSEHGEAGEQVDPSEVGPAKIPETQGEIGHQGGVRSQGSTAQKQPAEVDETPLNPLITRIQVERSNDTGPRGTGSVSRYRLRTAIDSMIAGHFRFVAAIGEHGRGPHRRRQHTDQQTRRYCTAIYPWDRAKKGQ